MNYNKSLKSLKSLKPLETKRNEQSNDSLSYMLDPIYKNSYIC